MEHVVPFCLWAFVNLSSRLKTYCIFCINWNSVLFSSVVFISFVGDNENIPFRLHHNRKTLHQMLRALFDIVRLDVFFVDVAIFNVYIQPSIRCTRCRWVHFSYLVDLVVIKYAEDREWMGWGCIYAQAAFEMSSLTTSISLKMVLGQGQICVCS